MARRRTRKVNLRRAYEMSGFTSGYAWFVREKVVPVIGDAALHRMSSRSGSREYEYSVTKNNFHRVVKALNIQDEGYKKTKLLEKAIRQSDPEELARAITSIVQSNTPVPVPTPRENFPVCMYIPMHPISHNMLYEGAGRGMRRTSLYNKHRDEFFEYVTAQFNSDEINRLIDTRAPMEVIYTFGHREKSKRGGVFDRSNFQKASQDLVFEFLGSDDSKVLESSIKGEFVHNYKDGYIKVEIRNI